MSATTVSTSTIQQMVPAVVAAMAAGGGAGILRTLGTTTEHSAAHLNLYQGNPYPLSPVRLTSTWNNHTNHNHTYQYTTSVIDVSSESPPTAAVDPYKSSSFVGHSLWMVPTGESLSNFQEIIDETAEYLGTESFVPHVTLVAGLMDPIDTIVEQTHLLASQLQPYNFHWPSSFETDFEEEKEMGFRDAYFQCVYAQLDSSRDMENEDVMASNAMARSIFPSKQKDPPYMPHLSLVYGDLTDSHKTQQVIPFLQKQLQSKQQGAEDLWTQLPVDAIEIWSTQGHVQDWYLVERVPLGGPSSFTTR